MRAWTRLIWLRIGNKWQDIVKIVSVGRVCGADVAVHGNIRTAHTAYAADRRLGSIDCREFLDK